MPPKPAAKKWPPVEPATAKNAKKMTAFLTAFLRGTPAQLAARAIEYARPEELQEHFPHTNSDNAYEDSNTDSQASHDSERRYERSREMARGDIRARDELTERQLRWCRAFLGVFAVHDRGHAAAVARVDAVVAAVLAARELNMQIHRMYKRQSDYLDSDNSGNEEVLPGLEREAAARVAAIRKLAAEFSAAEYARFKAAVKSFIATKPGAVLNSMHPSARRGSNYAAYHAHRERGAKQVATIVSLTPPLVVARRPGKILFPGGREYLEMQKRHAGGFFSR